MIDIDIVQPDGGMAHFNLTGSRLPDLDFFPAHYLGAAGFVHSDGVSHIGFPSIVP
jgi:hypothetical protein